MSLAESRAELYDVEILVSKEKVQTCIGEDIESSILSLLRNPITLKPYLFMSPLPTIALTVSSDGQSIHQKNNFTSVGFRSNNTQSSNDISILATSQTKRDTKEGFYFGFGRLYTNLRGLERRGVWLKYWVVQ